MRKEKTFLEGAEEKEKKLSIKKGAEQIKRDWDAEDAEQAIEDFVIQAQSKTERREMIKDLRSKLKEMEQAPLVERPGVHEQFDFSDEKDIKELVAEIKDDRKVNTPEEIDIDISDLQSYEVSGTIDITPLDNKVSVADIPLEKDWFAEKSKAGDYQIDLDTVDKLDGEAEALIRIKGMSEFASLKKIGKDIDARHKMAPETFPFTSKDILSDMAKLGIYKDYIFQLGAKIKNLNHKMKMDKKKAPLYKRLFSRKKSFLDPEELENYEEMQEDYNGHMKKYTERYSDFMKTFKELERLAETGNSKIASFLSIKGLMPTAPREIIQLKGR